MNRLHRPLVFLTLVIVPAALAQADPAVEIRNARSPYDDVLSGGQPTPEQIEALAAAGFKTVINVRGEGEEGYAWERAAVEKLGMSYVQIPVAGAAGLSRENVERVSAAIDEGRQAGPVLLHCASGNRIGALLALREHWVKQVPADEALEFGLANGLTRLEAKTRELLGLGND